MVKFYLINTHLWFVCLSFDHQVKVPFMWSSARRLAFCSMLPNIPSSWWMNSVSKYWPSYLWTACYYSLLWFISLWAIFGKDDPSCISQASHQHVLQILISNMPMFLQKHCGYYDCILTCSLICLPKWVYSNVRGKEYELDREIPLWKKFG